MPKKFKRIPHRMIVIPIYNRPVYLYRHADEFDAHLKGHEDFVRKTGDQYGRTVCIAGRSDITVGWFKGGFETLVHELDHVAFMILETAGIPANETHDEAHAYLLQYLVKEFLHEMATGGR